MVYRLYRANRFLMSRIFIVLLIYSLIIGSIGFVLLGVVVNFDAQSFNPSVYDANVPNAGTDLTTGKICDNYKGDTCQWYLYNDLQTLPLYQKFAPELTILKDRVDIQNLLMIQDQRTNQSSLVSAAASLDSFAFNSTFAPNFYYPTVGNYTCFSLLKGSSCNSFNLNSSTTQLKNETFQLLPNLHLFNGYNISSNSFNINGYFLGSSVLIDNSTNLILCKNYPQNCPYSKVKPYLYTDLQKHTNITAQQAIIYPFTQISKTDGIKDADNGTVPHVICQNEINTTTNFCGQSRLNVYTPQDYFVFLDDLNHIRVGTIGLADIVYPGIQNNILNLNQNNIQNGYACVLTGNLNGITQIMNQEFIDCLQARTDQITQATTIVNQPFPLDGKENVLAPKLLFSLTPDSIQVKIGLLRSTTQGKSTPAILLNIISRPALLLKNITTNDITSQVLLVALISFVINLLLALLLILLRFWKRVGGWLGPKSTLMLRGKLGGLLELTQFFEFGGAWYLEAQSVNDYNFKTTMGVVHELVRERWRDTIFFPTSLAASISIVIFSLYADYLSIMSLFVLGGILPLLLAFWIPPLWTIQDSGLKRAEWDNNGELLTIQKISDILRDGFNKLVGFSAIFGIGTAGASVARARITGSSVSTATALTGGFQNLIDLNFNFLASAILWTTALLFIVTAVSLTGNVITSLSYLNTDHLGNVKKMRTKLQQKEIFLGTTQPAMDHANRDTSVYFDSKQGIDSVLAQQSTGRGKALPENTIIAKQAFREEEDLTKIIIADPKDFESEPEKSDQTASSKSSGEESSTTDTEENTQESSITESENKSEDKSTGSTEQESTESSETQGETSQTESTNSENDTSTDDSPDSNDKKDE